MLSGKSNVNVAHATILPRAANHFVKIVREVMDGLDVFVGKYLVLVATAYIGIKFLHFKVFPDVIAF
jgi:hypothetical protein